MPLFKLPALAAQSIRTDCCTGKNKKETMMRGEEEQRWSMLNRCCYDRSGCILYSNVTLHAIFSTLTKGCAAVIRIHLPTVENWPKQRQKSVKYLQHTLTSAFKMLVWLVLLKQRDLCGVVNTLLLAYKTQNGDKQAVQQTHRRLLSWWRLCPSCPPADPSGSRTQSGSQEYWRPEDDKYYTLHFLDY